MKKIGALNSRLSRVKVMLGGAPVTQGYADAIGGDGSCDNANGAVKSAQRFVGIERKR